MGLIFPEGLNFDCGACSRCCRGWTVHFDARAWHQVKASPLFERLTQENGETPAFLEDEAAGESSARGRLTKGACAFLAPDRACRIHREMGASAKPFGCTQFPFLVRPTPDGAYVGVSFFCSAVQANHGRPLPEHVGELERALQSHHFPAIGDTVALDSEHIIAWPLYRDIEADCARALADALSLRDGLWLASMRILLMSSLVDRALLPPSEAWARARNADIPVDESVRQLEEMLLVSIVATLESRNPEACKANTEALFFRAQVETETFGPLDLTWFNDFRGRYDASWSEREMRRYVEHLLFRKFLAYKRNVAANAAAWHMILPLLEWYRDLSAYAARRTHPDITDVHRAFEVVERCFTLHTTLLDGLFEEMARGFRGLIEQMPDLIPGGPS